MSNLLRQIAEIMEKPILFLLIALIIVTLAILGSLIAEIFTEHRHLKVSMPVLMEELRRPETDREECIRHSGLLGRQKKALTELLHHPDFTVKMREALALRLLEQERAVWQTRIKRTDLIARLGPMLGLLGTLIPLGPGIQALGSGETEILSASLLTAFDTTIAGILCAAVAMLVSYVRRKWYADYLSIQETLTECILEILKDAE